ncbi:MAG TPA: hypothetical protein VFQ58_10670 [Flavisolibacter sp.]|jgi:hypothetical protein|nr:hypothetical protein [Flavisolibacter sp.]
MALNVRINYEGKDITYEVESTQEEVYILRMNRDSEKENKGKIPQKLVIRRKGKIWISDAENYTNLVNTLTSELKAFTSNTVL